MPRRKAEIDLIVNDKGSKEITKATQKVDRSLDKVEKKSKQVTNNMRKHWKKNVAGTITKVASIIGAVTVGVGLKFNQLSSQMEETQGKFNVVFRGMSQEAESWSTSLQSAFFMSELASKKYLSSIQDLLVPTGLARDNAGQLSAAFVALAGDLASFNNLPTAQVVRDIQSALQGSSETMAKYGINVKAMKVEEEIFRLGLVDTKDKITDAHKALAIYSIAMREGADAVGDMERTQGSFANQFKLFKTNLENTAISIGKMLLPVMNNILVYANAWFRINEELFSQDMPGWLAHLTDNLALYINAIDIYFRGVRLIFNGIMIIIKSLLIGIVEVTSAIINGPTKAVNELIKQMNKLPGVNIPIIKTFDGLEKASDKVMESLQGNIDNVKELFNKPLLGNQLKKAIAEVREEVEKIKRELNMETMLEGLQTPGKGGDDSGDGDGKKPLETIINQGKRVETVLDRIKQKAKNATVTMEDIFDTVDMNINSSFDNIIDGTESVQDAFRSMVTNILKDLARMYMQKGVTQLLSIAASAVGSYFGGFNVGGAQGTSTGTGGGYNMGGGQVSGLATGGIASSGSTYMVGERQPELVTFGQTARVTPMSQVSSGSTVIVNNYNTFEEGSMSSEEKARQRIEQMARMVKQQIKSTIRDEKRVGGMMHQNQSRGSV